ncbi:hypothetical protein FRB93_011686 [Tulasnella sp. JGI-2019a]|nr:hypothetical protein FRB93_011686 [Tulasnella sp. JGI-2019a]
MTFAPTVPEQNVVTAIFNKGDPDKLGIINGENAVKILTGAKLPPTLLGEIWAIADSDNNGFLTRKGVAVAVRLIGWAQKGESVSEDLLDKVGPLAQIDGISLPKLPSSSPTPSSPSMASSIPSISAADRAKFIRLFVGCGPSGGLLTGEKARDVFVKSNLPVEKLGQIWNLSDTQSRGALDQTDFIIGMFFIQLAMSQPKFVIPASLPPGLYDQASGGRPMTQIQSHNTGGSSGYRSQNAPVGVSSPLKPQYTGQALRSQATGGAVLPQHTGQLSSPQHTGTAGSRVSFAPNALSSSQQSASGEFWDISPREKSTADNFFATLDTQKRGFIEGDTAVPFFLKSALPESVLAQIWDLSDLHKDGQLTQDGFAIALHLINGKLAGKDVPETLPESLVPPALRKPVNQLSEIQQDLWLLGDTPPASANNTESPFAQQQATATRSQPPAPQHRPRVSVTGPNRDFMSDDTNDASPEQSVPDHSVKIGNVQNQLDSTNRSLNGAKTDRASLESSVTSSAATLSQLETQLAAAKAAYETEIRLVSDLRTRYATQTAGINKTREELITAESDLSALRQEKAEIEGGVLRDKEEVRELQRKMKQVGDETEVIKKEIDRVKKDARHQKGLLAINKKQVATAEGEREKQEKELELTRKELELATKEVEDAQAAEEETKARFASRSTTVSPAPEESHGFPPMLSENQAVPISPAASVTRSTGSKNPFDKLMGSGASTPRSASTYLPFAQPEPTAQDDDPFGFATAFAAAPVATPPPVASRIVSPSAESPPPRIASPAILRPKSPELTVASPAPIRPKSPESMTLLEVQPARAASPDRQATAFEDTSRFPALEAISGTSGPTSTDLPPLKELEHDSDSDSDTDSDDLPLASSAAVKAREAKEIHLQARPTSDLTSPSHDSTFDTAPEDSINETPTPHRSQSPESYPAVSSQHLGAASPAPAVTPTQTQPTEKPSAPFEPTSQSQSLFTPAANTTLEPKSTTVSDFDEAFGQMGSSKPNGAASEQVAFKFDDAFGDTFDFGSTPSMDLTTPATTSNVAVFQPANLSADSADLFPIPHVNGTTAKPLNSNTTAPPSAAPVTVSFDDAFGIPSGQQPQPSATQPFELSSPTVSREASTISTGGSQRPVSPTASMATSVTSTPASRPVPAIPTSPTNGRSSPQRPSGNGSMRSSGRDRDNGIKFQPPPAAEQPAPAKSSKFHFPGFGRSKTQKRQKSTPAAAYAPMPGDRQTSTSSRSPSILDPTSVTDAGGDVEGVKRIMEMGFTRDQAVVALEKHGYDLRLALADLLGEGGAQS